MSSSVHRSRVRQSAIWGAVLSVAVAAGALAFVSPARAWTPPAQPTYADVLTSDPFYLHVEAMHAVGAMSGYACGGPGEPCDAQVRPYFRPFNDITRAQASKAVALVANLPLSASTQSFADVLPSNPFFAYIEAMYAVGATSGYSCGGPGEPCDALSRPYFRPYNYVTRAQLAKFVAVAGGIGLASPPAQPSFADVPASNPFYAAIEALRSIGAVSGYNCGGPGELCDALSRPYFRPYNYVTRGQTAKMVALALVFSDTTAPSLFAPVGIVTEATGPAGAVVSFSVAATDPDDPVKATACVPASGSTFPLGATTVTCTAEDTHLNTATGSFVVTVQDQTPPAFRVTPKGLIVDATSSSGAIVSYTAPTAWDLVDGAIVAKCAPASGSLFPIGVTTVKCSAVDAHRNVGTTSFSVTVNKP